MRSADADDEEEEDDEDDEEAEATGRSTATLTTGTDSPVSMLSSTTTLPDSSAKSHGSTRSAADANDAEPL